MSTRRTEFSGVALLILCLMVPAFIACAEEKQEPTYNAEEGVVPQKHNYRPEAGYVPDAETAIAVAVAVWTPIYGREQIESEKPYNASLEDGVWYVTGTLPEGPGGVAEAEIGKDDGCILRISHGE